MLPTAGFTDQVTAVFEAPATVAVNACVPEGARVALPGVRATLIGGARVMLALPELRTPVRVVAVTVTVCAEPIDEGAM